MTPKDGIHIKILQRMIVIVVSSIYWALEPECQIRMFM